MGVGRVASPQGVGSHNALMLASQGRLRPSLRVAAEDWTQSLIFKQAIRARDDLWLAGTPFKGRPIPKGALLVNRKGQTIPARWRADELAQFGDHGDSSEIRKMAEEMTSGFMTDDPAVMSEWKQTQNWQDLRVVPQRLVERYYRQFRSTPRGVEGKLVDGMVDLVSTSIVFARIGYIPKNVVQNVIMTVPHQGPMFLVNAVRAGQLLADPETRGLILSEVGSSGAARSLDTGTGKLGKVTHKIKGFVGGTADDLFRAAAFVHELGAEGVLPKGKPILGEDGKEKFIKFMTSEKPKDVAIKNDVNYRANQAMADFSRMTPGQMRRARRLLIVPGWLMAGTQYPFRFAAHHPIRSALIAYLAMGDPGAPKELRFKPLWTHLHGEKWLEGINTPWGRLRTGSISPVSTPLDVLRAVAHIGDASMWDEAQPWVKTAFDFLSGTIASKQGSYKDTYWGIAKHDIPRLAPGAYQFPRDLISPPKNPYYPEDVTRLGRLKRELGVIPIRTPDMAPRGGLPSLPPLPPLAPLPPLPPLRG
jgi:hypothetical protein